MESFARHAVKWLSITLALSLVIGGTAAGFMALTDLLTGVRGRHPALLWGLPLAGFATGWLYARYGRHIDTVNNLVIDEIHAPRGRIPLLLAPLVAGTTLLSHCFGASVGRAGAMLQIAGTLAEQQARLFRLGGADRRLVLIASLSAGFAAIFGTPLAGALFGVEILAAAHRRYHALPLCLAVAFLSDRVVALLGIHRIFYGVPEIPALSAWVVVAVALAGGVFGLAGRAFATGIAVMRRWAGRLVPGAAPRAALGGLVLALAMPALGTDRFAGLGIPTIYAAFHETLPAHDFLAKLGLTIVSVGTGFRGGEITPLFFIGACLGNALAPLLGLPFPLLAGLGLAAVFAGATRTPIASTVLAMELFGPDIGVPAGIACAIAHLVAAGAVRLTGITR